MTGRQPARVGMPGVMCAQQPPSLAASYSSNAGGLRRCGGRSNSLSAAGLPLSEVTLADDLRASGYHTLALGKWCAPALLPDVAAG